MSTNNAILGRTSQQWICHTNTFDLLECKHNLPKWQCNRAAKYWSRRFARSLPTARVSRQQLKQKNIYYRKLLCLLALQWLQHFAIKVTFNKQKKQDWAKKLGNCHGTYKKGLWLRKKEDILQEVYETNDREV